VLGCCGSGKTRLCYKVCTGDDVDTVTSMEAHSLQMELPSSRSVEVVDFPGHPRLRSGLAKELQSAHCIIFVVDSAALASTARAAAEMLFDVLTDPAIERCKGLLVVCNKSDKAPGRDSRVRAALTRELEALRGTRGTVAGSDDNFLPLGRHGQPLDLNIDSPCPLSIDTCSALSGNVSCVSNFVENCLRC
jgi:signal recognition particle receptor subunit beta